MLPKEFKERMTAILGDEAERLFDELENTEAVKAFRVNGIKCDAKALEDAGATIDRDGSLWVENAYYTKEKYPGSLPEHHAGAIYMQDPSAMATVTALNDLDGSTVLDCCAAPGGKTGQLCAAVGTNGVVFANEYESSRAKILYSNVERLGCANVIITNVDTSTYRDDYKRYFDVVVCDAPCSGEGMFRKNERAIEEWSVENVIMCAERQREILSNVAPCVKAGGRLLYSTCTFSLEENEMNVAWLLGNYPEFELCDVPCDLKSATSDGVNIEGCEYDMTKTRRCYPHVSKGEGQFIALFKRRSDGDDGAQNGAEPVGVGGVNGVEDRERFSKKQRNKDKKALEKGKKINNKYQNKQDVELIELGKRFLEQNLASVPDGELLVLWDKLWLCPRAELLDRGLISAGVCLGEAQKGRFVPHHQLFSAFGNLFVRKLRLSYSGPRTSAYLFGEELSLDGILRLGGDWQASFKENVDARSRDEEDAYFAPVGSENGWAAVILGGCAAGAVKVSGGVAKNHYPKGLRNKRIG